MSAQSKHLKSELAQYCLPRPGGHPERTLAWLNSICFLFLVVAVSGVRPRLPLPPAVPPLDQPVPIIIQPLPPPVQPQHLEPTTEPRNDENTATPRVVVVTPESPAINFSVPTIGNVIVPAALAQAPPVTPLQPSAPAEEGPTSIGSTGVGGDRPSPPYPKLALEFGAQGTVVLSLTADASGLIQSASIQESSGSAILDHSTLEFVKRHWTVSPGREGRRFVATISYHIKTS